MVKQAFKNMYVFWQEAGWTPEHDYTEQRTRLPVLKHFNGAGAAEAEKAGLVGQRYTTCAESIDPTVMAA